MPDTTVRCRAQVSKACTHGEPLINEFGDPEQDALHYDGTYLRSDHSIVCTACYIKLGTPLNPVLPNATANR